MKRSLVYLVFLTAMLGIFSGLWAQTTLEVPSDAYPTIQSAITAATAGDVILVSAGTYTGNIIINKSITLISASGSNLTILDGVSSSSGQGTIEVTAGVNNLRIGEIGHGFTIKGLDGPSGIEKSAVYFTGNHSNVIVEGNVLEARGDSAIQGEWSAANTNFVINSNVINGKTFIDENPGGVGFDSQFTTANVPRQLVVFGGGAGNVNTQNFTFTNNTVSGICGGYNIEALAYQGNQLVTLDLSGDNNFITGNTFSGYTTYTSAALRTRGNGTHTISGNVFNGSYPVNYTAMTTNLETRLTRTAAVYANNTFSKAVLIRDNLSAVKYGEIPTSINYAIYYAVSGQDVYVAAGTYNEHVLVNKSITLTGANRETTIINGGGTGTGSPLTGSVVVVTANNCTISGFSVTGTAPFVDLPNDNDEIYYAGIGLFNVTGCTVTNNKVYSAVLGIAGVGGTLNSITNNLASTCGIGIAVDNLDGSGTTDDDGATYFTVSNNTISYMQAHGIYIAEDCAYATVNNNTVSYCGETGIYFWKSSHSSASNNNVSLCNTGFENFGAAFNTFSSNTIQSNLTDGIRIEHGIYGTSFEPSSTDMTIQGNTVSGNGGFGIKISGSFLGSTANIIYTENNVVQNNIVHDNLNGIALGLGQDSSISINQVYNNNAYGILLIASTENTVELNNVYGNGYDGIAMDNANVLGGPLTAASTANYVKTNTISSNRDGIFIGQNCNGNLITDSNTITAVHSGIHLWRSDNQIISGNTISNCITGDEDEPGHGIRLYAASNNTITGNTLTGNAEGLFVRNFYDPAHEPDLFIPSLNNSIHDNNISGNTIYGLHSDNFSDHGVWSVVDASNNWWGANDGPAWKDYSNNAVAGGGTGNAITYVQYLGTDVVSFDPYSTRTVLNENQNEYYSTIQGAIDNATSGDVISIGAGITNLTSPILVNKSITLQGADPEAKEGETVLIGTNPNQVCVLEITAGNVTIENLDISHTSVPAFGSVTWNEQTMALVRIPETIEPDLSGIIFQNNTIHIPAQTGEMSTWTGIAMSIGKHSVAGITITGNTVYNTRNGVVAGYGTTHTISNNVIYNTKGGIMNYTNDLTDASHRNMSGNSWSTVHNEWDMVWNTGGTAVDPNYQLSVLALSNNNNGAYVCDLRSTATPASSLTGNRSHIFVNAASTVTSPSYNKGNMNAPYPSLAFGIPAVVSGGTVYIAAGEYTETGQIVISKNINLIGADKLTTIIKPAQNTGNSGDTRAWILVQNGYDFNLSNVTLDGSGYLTSIGILSHGTGTINNNIIKNIQYHASGPDYAGRGIAFYDHNMTISNNTLSNIGRIGIYANNCSAGVISGNTYTGKGLGDWLDYGIELEGGAVASITGNTITNCWGEASLDGSDSAAILGTTYWAPGTSATINNNTLSNNSTAVYFGYEPTDTSTFTMSGNTLSANEVHVCKVGVPPMDMSALLSNNTFDHTYILDQTIYGNAAMLYVTANNELIKDNEEQDYTVKAAYIEDLTGFTIEVKFPKAYFEAPSSIIAATGIDFFEWEIEADDNYHRYMVSGAHLDPMNGLDGEDVPLFTINIASKTDVNNEWINPIYTMIDLPLDSVILRDHQQPPLDIACLGTVEKDIVIDSGEPTMAVIPETSGLPLPTVVPPTDEVDTTTLTLSFSDNYNLDYIRYLIQPQTDPATVPAAAAFGTDVATSINGTLWNNGGAAWEIDNAELNLLDDGTYEIFFLAVDDAGNSYVNPTPWVFIIDTSAPEAISWLTCLTTPDANNSVDLAWEDDALHYDVWALSFSDLDGAGDYPVYNPSTYTPAIPVAPDPYNAQAQNGWTQLVNNLEDPLYVHHPADRGYFYYYVFAEDASGNISPASVLKESISYWPGDVVIDNAVDASDISALSAVWGTDAAANPACNVGPTVDRTRRGRPIPDNRINIEDLMIFAMNYMNTDYTVYNRVIPELNPIRIEMISQMVGDQLIVQLNLGSNNGFVKGLNIPILYGNGLTLQSVENGEIWPEDSIILQNIANNVVELSASTLGDTVVESNGRIATLTFNMSGSNSSLELQHMIARTIENSEIEIIDNPQETPSGNEDPENIIPVTSYLGANYPNPFNPSTTIQFGLNQTEQVKISIFNARGQMVKTLVNGIMPAGTHNVVWNGMDNNNRSLGSGLYFYRMETKTVNETKKAILIK